jgi:Zn-dependent protease
MKLFKIKLIQVEINLLLIFFVTFLGATAFRVGGLTLLLYFLIIFFILYSTVFAHELGHAFVAKRFGYECEKILLHPLGGIAYIHFPIINYKPNEEFWIALSGPLVNLALVCLFWPVSIVYPEAEFIVKLNLIMCVFNLLPLPVMDGGRILTSILSPHCKNLYTATKTSMIIGSVCVIPFFIFYINFWLIAIFVFVFWLGWNELRFIKFITETEQEMLLRLKGSTP